MQLKPMSFKGQLSFYFQYAMLPCLPLQGSLDFLLLPQIENYLEA